jgi:hypothetical protein
MTHICSRKDNLVQQHKDKFFFVINLLVPGPPRYSLVFYFQVTIQITDDLDRMTAKYMYGNNVLVCV